MQGVFMNLWSDLLGRWGVLYHYGLFFLYWA